jgi:hypothetical protein
MPLLNFDAVFKKKDIYKEYHKFLKQEQCEEPLEFLKKSLKYTKKLQETKMENDFNTTVERKNSSSKKLEKLRMDFVEESGPKAINISGKARGPLLEGLKNNHIGSLRPVQERLEAELKFDSFKRFMRTKPAQKLIKKYSNDTSVVIPE